MNQRLKRVLQSLTLILFMASVSLAQFTQMQLPQPSGFVNDFANKLSQETKGKLENLLTNFRNKAGIEVTLVTVPFEMMNNYPIEDFTLEIGRRWKVGKGADGPAAVLVVAIKPQNASGVYSGGTRLEISRHLEGDIPDGLAGELIRRMRSDFQKGNFDTALTTGVQAIVATIAERRGISMEGIDTNAAYRPQQQRRPSRGISGSTIIVMIIVFFILMSILSRFGGRGGGGGGRRRGSDWWVGPMIWSGGGGGWGGSGSSSSDSGGGGWGGFGGGGDFGGGGASDSW